MNRLITNAHHLTHSTTMVDDLSSSPPVTDRPAGHDPPGSRSLRRRLELLDRGERIGRTVPNCEVRLFPEAPISSSGRRPRRSRSNSWRGSADSPTFRCERAGRAAQHRDSAVRGAREQVEDGLLGVVGATAAVQAGARVANTKKAFSRSVTSSAPEKSKARGRILASSADTSVLRPASAFHSSEVRPQPLPEDLLAGRA